MRTQRLLDDFRRPRSIYSQVRDIINQRHTAHQLSAYLDDPLWDDLEDLLGDVVGQCKPIYFYLDALDEEFSHAPMYWLKCQEGCSTRSCGCSATTSWAAACTSSSASATSSCRRYTGQNMRRGTTTNRTYAS
jgi:hypothetical protein